MLRIRPLPLLGALMLLTPACAHDPLDTVSGEEDFSKQNESEEKPTSHKKERQEGEFRKEEEEMEAAQARTTEEHEEFLRDKTDLKDVLAAQHQRDLTSGSKHGSGGPKPDASPKPDSSSSSTTTVTHVKHVDKPADKSKSGGDSSIPKGDVDPTAADNDVDPGASKSKSSSSSVSHKAKSDKSAKSDDDSEEPGREDFDKKMAKEKKKSKSDEFDN
jgi:hypothetical protein